MSSRKRVPGGEFPQDRCECPESPPERRLDDPPFPRR